MGTIARFEYGSKRYSVNDARIALGDDFAPPATVVSIVAGRDRFDSTVYARAGQSRRWEFTVHVTANSETEATRVLEHLQTFLNLASNPKKPVYFAFREWGDDYPHEPLWGQFGALKRYKVRSGTVAFPRAYVTAVGDNKLMACPVSLVIDPFDYGLRQRLATAVGAVFDVWAGYGDKRSRGLQVARTVTGDENKITNPIFGHATWDTGWTAGANLSASKNTDEEYTLFGYVSARLISKGAASAATFTQSINVGSTATHVVSCYAKLANTGQGNDEITPYVEMVYDGVSLTTRALPLEQGWFRLYAKFTGVASSKAMGVRLVEEGTEVFATGFQVEANSFASPLRYGDLYGHAWSGTAHNSSSTCATAGKVGVPVERSDVEGCMQIVVQLIADSTDLSGNYYVFQDSADEFALYYDATNNRWTLTDGTSTLTSASTPALGDVFVFHITWEAISNALKLYVNGVLADSDVFGATANRPTTVYVGSTSGGASQGPFTIMGFDVFPVAMLAADVTTFYEQVAGILFSTGTAEDVMEAISTIPYLWTKDGDDVVDNCDDSSRDNWGLVGGVAGNVEAETEWTITPSVTNKAGYWLMRAMFDYGKFQYPTAQWYAELSGTVDANSSGGEYESGGSSGGEFGGLVVADPSLIEGRVHVFGRVKVSSAQDMLLYASGQPGTGIDILTETRRVAMTTSFCWFYAGTFYFEYAKSLAERNKYFRAYLWVEPVTGTNAMQVDFVMAFAGDVLRMKKASSTSITKLVVDGRSAIGVNSSEKIIVNMMNRGDEVNLIPNQQNIVWFVIGDDGEGHTITNTGTFDSIYVRPRWVLR